LLHYVTWGGGGWGDPFTRDPTLVAKEVGRGLVTRDGAKAYGVVLNTKGNVDEAATKKLRASMARKRGKVGIFDFGGSIAALRKTAKKETGLAAPKKPTFQFPVAAE
jgi:N-methylhydantoinase B